MRIELRKVHHSPALSRETEAFTAEVVIDGKVAGTVRNAGEGGPNDYHFRDRAVWSSFDGFCRALPPLDTKYGPLDNHPDLVIGELLEKWVHNQWLRRNCRGKTLFRMPDDKPGEWRVVKAPYSPQVRAYIEQKYPNARIANEELSA